MCYLQHATLLDNHDPGTCGEPEARTPGNGLSIFGNGAFCSARHYMAQTAPWAEDRAAGQADLVISP